MARLYSKMKRCIPLPGASQPERIQSEIKLSDAESREAAEPAIMHLNRNRVSVQAEQLKNVQKIRKLTVIECEKSGQHLAAPLTIC